LLVQPILAAETEPGWKVIKKARRMMRETFQSLVICKIEHLIEKRRQVI
jgi:hypothetical protein